MKPTISQNPRIKHLNDLYKKERRDFNRKHTERVQAVFMDVFRQIQVLQKVVSVAMKKARPCHVSVHKLGAIKYRRGRTVQLLLHQEAARKRTAIRAAKRRARLQQRKQLQNPLVETSSQPEV